MISVVGGNALVGPTGAELTNQSIAGFTNSLQNYAQMQEQRSQRRQTAADAAARLQLEQQQLSLAQARLLEEQFVQDQAIATTQIANMAKERNEPMPVFLKTDAGKAAVMAFAPKLFRGVDASKKAEQWLAAYDAAPLEGQQALKAVEDAKLRGEMVPETQFQPGQTPDFRSFLPASQQGAPESTPAQAPTLPVNAPVLPPPAATAQSTQAAPVGAPIAGGVTQRGNVLPGGYAPNQTLTRENIATTPSMGPYPLSGRTPGASIPQAARSPTAAAPPTSEPQTQTQNAPQVSFREFLLAKAARVPGISIDPAGSETDQELMAKAPASRQEYEAYKRGIAPAWANRKPAATSAPQAASVTASQTAGSITEGADLSKARAIGLTDAEVSALQALNTATDPSQLDNKTQVLYSRALSKIEMASRKEIKRYKFTPEARARFSEANANMLETVAANIEEDSPLRGDPRMSHIFENPAQIDIDAAKSEIALKNAQATKALVDAGYAGEELALKKRQIQAMEVAAAAEAIAAQSPAFKDIVSALDASLKRREEEVGNILKNAKTPKEYEKARAEVNAILAKDPIYNKEKESWTKLMGEWGKLGLTPVDIALVRRGLFGGLKQEGVQTTIALSPVGGPAAIAAGGSLYNDQATVDSLEAKYGF
jgi:hypothetical protein